MTLNELKEKIKENNLDALLVNNNNMFLEQEIPLEENYIYKLTNFSGSAGELIVTNDKSYLFIDGRYEIQAKLETDPNEVVVIVKENSMTEFLSLHSKKSIFYNKENIKLGFNPWTISIRKHDSLSHVSNSREYNPKEALSLVPCYIIPSHTVSKKANIFELDIKYAGISREDKIKKLLDVKNSSIDAYIISAPDNVSWLLNIRSDYLDNTPIVRAIAIVDKSGDIKVFSDDFENFADIKIFPIIEFENELKKYEGKIVSFDYYSPYILKILAEKHNINAKNFFDLTGDRKSIKNEVEINGFINAHIRDGVAVTKLLYWIENNWQNKTELDVVKKLKELRSEQPLFFSNSFDTIAGFAENGAIVHYHPTVKTNKTLENGSFLLIDSGGQYFDGTTDATRTIAIGDIKQELKDNFTVVLKAHIALAAAKFPEKKTSGMSLDIISRSVMWRYGKDYAHGTGHGVGHFSGVHEGPQRISPVDGYYPISENMVVSIEPGYYSEGNYGIRIENLYRVIKSDSNMLAFETLTLIPIDTRIVNFDLLTNEEKKWLNDYNKSIYEKLKDYLTEEEKSWIKESII